MSRKTIIIIGMVVGSCLGGYCTTLLGAGAISFWSLIGSSVGGLLGIYIAFKLSS
ncbi:MAG: hypothetical protein PHC61_03395 [Chitinivibrionales bacterium]|nr:hypothetical protein [Chitinivibrionales bacterium]